MPTPTRSLEEAGYAFWGAYLNDVVNGAEVYAEIEAGCADYYFEGAFVELIFYPGAGFAVDGAVVEGYLDSVYPEDQEKVGEWVKQIIGRQPGITALAAIERLSAAIYEQIKYRRREERGVQSPAKTLNFRNGSCRDMATLLLEACRHLSIAARFVSGYLNSSASRAGVGATHAWMEAYLPDCGWIGFDPTIGEGVSHKHIPLGVSSHPRGVMPISGTYIGDRVNYLGMEVAISIKELTDENVEAAALD